MFNNNDINLLYANGCSWTFGNGLSEDPLFDKGNNIHGYQSTLTWPGQLSKMLGCDFINDSIGGGSNHRMLRTTCQFLKKYPKNRRKNLLIIIGWTSLERDEIYLDDGLNRNWLYFNSGQNVETNHVFRKQQYSRNTLNYLKRYQYLYRNYVQHTYSGFVQWINQLYLLSNALDNLGIKFMFFSSIGGWKWGNGFTININNEFGKEMARFSEPRYMGLSGGFTMAEYCLKNNLPLSTCKHPMIDGHRSWAEFLYKKIKEIY